MDGYWDGEQSFVCISCSHEWPTTSSSPVPTPVQDHDLAIDSNGNTIVTGDTVILIKDVAKGLNKGLKLKKIRVGDYGDKHNLQATIKALGTYNIKSEFVKKVK